MLSIVFCVVPCSTGCFYTRYHLTLANFLLKEGLTRFLKCFWWYLPHSSLSKVPSKQYLRKNFHLLNASYSKKLARTEIHTHMQICQLKQKYRFFLNV